jgi:hypothetical protein
MKNLKSECERIYNAKGQTAVFDFINKLSPLKMKTLKVAYEDCKQCETSSPAQDHVCLVCGSTTVPRVKEFRITYRMEFYVKADTEKEALAEFENIPMLEMVSKSAYVERVSIDEEN